MSKAAPMSEAAQVSPGTPSPEATPPETAARETTAPTADRPAADASTTGAPPADTGLLMRQATWAAVAAAATLIVIKIAAWVMTDSVALLSTTIDSVLDGCASLINLWAVHHALQPADDKHRFGHGKAEPLAGLAQAAFVAGSALLLMVQGGSRLMSPAPTQREEIGIAVMVVSIIITIMLVSFQKYVIRRSSSVAISADSLHYSGDVMINLSVIVSLLLSRYINLPWIDPLFGMAIAAYLLYNAWVIATGSLDLLMDKEFPEEDRQKIISIALGHKLVYDAHDLRTRSSGQQQFIQLHLELDPAFSLAKAHGIADRVERDIRAAFPLAEVIIHQDPAGIRENHHNPHSYDDRVHGIPDGKRPSLP